MARREHTDHEFESELLLLRSRLQAMGRVVVTMILHSMQALREGDRDTARRMIGSDEEVDRFELEIDELCLRILARRQPVASDLRLIASALKGVTDLERIGDLCGNICERVIESDETASMSVPGDLVEMGKGVYEMVSDVMVALEAGNAEQAEEIIGRDRRIDALRVQVSREALRLMIEDPRNTQQASSLQVVAQCLERIGDHAKNLAELVIFLAKGKDVRHPKEAKNSSPLPSPRGVLFLCVHNSARSQMAEGWAKLIFPRGMKVWSAGSAPLDRVDPMAVRVMSEVGVDISSHRPKRISDIPLSNVDAVITLCAEELCLTIPGILYRETWALPDPKGVTGDEDGVLHSYREIRNELRKRLAAFVERLGDTGKLGNLGLS